MNLYKDIPNIRYCQYLNLGIYKFIMKTFEERIRFIRGSRTMKEFADLIGATQQKVSNYENGKVKPTFDIFERLSKAGFNVDWLLTGEGEIYTVAVSSKAVGLKEEIAKLRAENEAVKKMVGYEAVKYINAHLSVNEKPQKYSFKKIKKGG